MVSCKDKLFFFFLGGLFCFYRGDLLKTALCCTAEELEVLLPGGLGTLQTEGVIQNQLV